MTLYVKDTDIEVRGTLESVKGVALASGIDADGSPIYMGGTEMWWDEQRIVVDPHGAAIWVDENGDTHPQSRIEDRP